MASVITTTTTTTALTLTSLHLTKLSFLSLHRSATSFRTLSPRLCSSLSSLHHHDSPSFSPKHPSSSTLLNPNISDDLLAPHAFPAASSLHALVEKTAPRKVVVAEKKKAATTTTEEPKYSKAARRFFNQRFREPPQRLAKVLAAAGVASRRSSEELIFQRKVTVNGTVCDKPQTRVDPGKDVIYVNGNRLPKRLPPKVYLALNKPKGYICSSGQKESKSVLCLFDDFLKSWDKRFPGELKPRLFTVGRLDVATTGLIIVTNDGDFAQRVSHPSSNLTKEYLATVVGQVHKRHLMALSQGTAIDGVHCTPESVELLPRQPDNLRDRLRIVVNEGRNHEVRELVKNAGLEIHSLKRTRIGGFRLSTDLR
ncbi:hypothetical protein RND81_07G034900 [Saponaria officinalis]